MSTWSAAPSLLHAHDGLAAATTGFIGLPIFLTLEVFAIGGSGDSGDVEALSNPYPRTFPPPKQSWAAAASMTTPRFGHAACVGFDHRIYAIGGRNNPSGSLLSAVEAYAPGGVKGSWAAVKPMAIARERAVAAAGPDGLIYVAGGSNGSSSDMSVPLKTVEAYDIATNTWVPKPNMHTARDGAAAVTGSDGRIYVIGGFGSNSKSLNSVEAYDTTTHSWTSVTSMSTPRDGLGAVLGLDGHIYAIGGENGPEVLATVEVYNFSTKTWSPGPSLSTARTYHAVAMQVNGGICAIGGDTGILGPTNSVEVMFTV